uniref:Uncharacterized protein n=1 Tax=Rhizophora mucronata TaxID=61149 RepID=A0A2P2R0G3_RHIMU
MVQLSCIDPLCCGIGAKKLIFIFYTVA